MSTALTPQLPSPRRKGEQRREMLGNWGPPLILLVAFLIVTLLVWRGATDGLDGRLIVWMQAQLLPHLVGFWRVVSWPGYAPQSYGMAILFIVLAAVYADWRGALLMLIAVLSSPLGSLVKRLVDRPRPTPEQAQVIGALIRNASYPSGHVVTYTAICGLMILLVRAASPAGRWERRRDGLFCGILVALIVLVGPSRVILGDHWPTDVLGGYLLGGLVLACVARWRRAVRPPPGASEASQWS